ncbi:MAG: hypothetical protein ABI823_17715, partial [Bryobacteraceae bacterium]
MLEPIAAADTTLAAETAPAPDTAAAAATRAERNRLNAQKSTGPKTIEGKKRASLNALDHGLSG